MASKRIPRSYSLRRPLAWVGGLVGVWIVSGWMGSAEFGWAPIWPPVVALGAILLSRRVLFSLALGGLAGALVLSEGDLGHAVLSIFHNHLRPALQSPWKAGALVFTLMLGGFAAILEAGGGLRRLLEKWTRGSGDVRRRFQWSTVGLGTICFFDGLANSVLVGRVCRNLADSSRVARVKLAYLVDSTSSSVASVAFISTWIATQLTLIDDALVTVGVRDELAPYGVFFGSIPLNFYVWFTLALLLLSIAFDWNPGPMRRFERAARAAPPPSAPRREEPAPATGSLASALVPLAVLVLGIMATFYLWEARPLWPFTFEKVALAFSSADGPYILLTGSALGLIAAIALYPRATAPVPAPAAFLEGVRTLLLPLTVLLFAWILGSVLRDLGTARFIAQVLEGGFDPRWLPATVFLTGVAISFTTGTSWGTMGLLMPIALPLVFLLQPEVAATAALPLVYGVVAAVFAGAVFGDHCSPFSDTTLVSSVTCGVRPLDHVRTQLPYALTAAGAALVVGFIPAGFGWWPAWLSLLAGVILLAILVKAVPRTADS